ncbi:MAG: sigma-70 family RNA polymerase sigma factor [SAR202 cluster bacterium]|jgi:RNA polymerase sigma-70 factor (ECF subfamily)|nr:sigma-70 family RNA polymerase sigma factor [SAR202 cluster bacterium]MDP6512667.1 sigma-70 family RNA polymerase sigma factor [SAR202 cluster bacterium]MDP6715687.1 sigma-70 family RNA polymerase sigma factor [SAR202 cluster bacterium]
MNYEELEDGQLLESIAGKDRGALEALYTRYSGPVYSLAMHLLRDPGASEEVTQDTFFNVWRRGSSYKSNRGSVTAWLFSIAHHRTIDELRKRRRDQTRVQHGVDMSQRPTEARSDDPTEYATAQFESSRLKEALTVLRPEQREVVILAYFGGFTHSEIARKLDQPLGTVKTRMRLAIKKLRGVIGPTRQESAEYGL